MSCNCIEEVNKTLKETYDDPSACVAVGFQLGNGTIDVKPCGLYAIITEKKLNGEYRLKPSEVPIVPVYCPFCGIKYDQPQDKEVTPQ
jgi:hypothetical protein